MAIIAPSVVGEPAPWFSAPKSISPRDSVAFDELAGRYIVLFFFGSAARSDAAEALTLLGVRNDLFDGSRALLVGISSNQNAFNQRRLAQGHAGQLFLWDCDGAIAKRYNAIGSNAAEVSAGIRPIAFIVSPSLQIISIVQPTEPTTFAGLIVSVLTKLLISPPTTQNAPVLVVPQVFDGAFCQRLIELYDAAGGREIGQIENQGKIVERADPVFRKRLDYYISDEQALQDTRALLERRLLPMIYRAFQFRTTRIERYLVGCYDAETGGYFRPHRDNTAPVVAHRRFAATINLNEGYEGGDLCFPEFGHQAFRTSPGDAIAFSCSLLHEVRPLTRGRRYAFLTFFYDEQSQALREAYSRKMLASQAPAKAS
jgi:predicted 2-oxoglutarate/Fe(II)-dependent dioxygenase YbiX/peroxiredoxin